MNKPYVREVGVKKVKGEIKEPYISKHPNRSQRRKKLNRAFNNKEGVQVVIVPTGRGTFARINKEFQKFKGKTIVQSKIKFSRWPQLRQTEEDSDSTKEN